MRDEGEEFYVRVFMSQDEERAARRLALEQNITTLRNRVNALGVAEPVIQQQGDRRIVVELPGVRTRQGERPARRDRDAGVSAGAR